MTTTVKEAFEFAGILYLFFFIYFLSSQQHVVIPSGILPFSHISTLSHKASVLAGQLRKVCAVVQNEFYFWWNVSRKQ